MKVPTAKSKVFPPLLILACGMGFIELLVQYGFVRDYFLPAPSQVLKAIGEERELLAEATLSTLFSASIGLLLSFFIGTFLAVLFSVSSFLRRAVYPYAVFFQTVPVISIAPLLVIWFGFGQPTVIACSFIVSIFPVIANGLLGLQSADPHLLELFKLYSASPLDCFLKLKFPSALPSLFAGLRIASGLAIVGAIVGEFIAGGGLGGIVDSARTQQRVDLVFASVVISSLLGLIFVVCINLMSIKALHTKN